MIYLFILLLHLNKILHTDPHKKYLAAYLHTACPPQQFLHVMRALLASTC